MKAVFEAKIALQDLPNRDEENVSFSFSSIIEEVQTIKIWIDLSVTKNVNVNNYFHKAGNYKLF